MRVYENMRVKIEREKKTIDRALERGTYRGEERVRHILKRMISQAEASEHLKPTSLPLLTHSLPKETILISRLSRANALI